MFRKKMGIFYINLEMLALESITSVKGNLPCYLLALFQQIKRVTMNFSLLYASFKVVEWQASLNHADLGLESELSETGPFPSSHLLAPFQQIKRGTMMIPHLYASYKGMEWQASLNHADLGLGSELSETGPFSK